MALVNRELFKGNAQTIVLKILSKKEMYGYQIAQEVNQLSSGNFELTDGTLYPLLHALESDGAVESYWEDSQSARKRKFYRITSKGKKRLKEKMEEWSAFRAGMDLILQTRMSVIAFGG